MVGSFERNWHEIESVYEAVEGVSKKGKIFHGNFSDSYFPRSSTWCA